MIPGLWLFDWVCALTLLTLASLALMTKDLLNAITWYIVFGLMMGVVWVRLRVPDVALAEVAIGAGLTGALLLSTWNYLRQVPAAREERHDPPA